MVFSIKDKNKARKEGIWCMRDCNFIQGGQGRSY